MTVITREALEASGYSGPYPHHQGEFCHGLWQKTFRGPNHEKLYFINVYLWSFPDVVVTGGRESASVEVALFRNDGLTADNETDFRVSVLIGPNTTLRQLEAFYAELYTKLGCIPDVHNNDGLSPPPVNQPTRFERI